MRIMTWNIWSGKNWEGIVDGVKSHRIELMGFQEVDNHLPRTGLINITEKIAQSLGYFWAYSPSIENQATGVTAGGQFGNAVISKYPIIESQRHFLSTPEEWNGTAQTESRTILETKIQINDIVICFMTLHLGYSRQFKTTILKMKQIEKVIEIIQKNKDFPTILLGDFNSLPESEEISLMKQYLKDVDNKNILKTWTTYDFEHDDWKVPAGLNYKIDYIFVSKHIKYGLPKIEENKISDHVPLFIDIEVNNT